MTWEEISGAFTKQFVPKLQVGAGSRCWLCLWVGWCFGAGPCGHLLAQRAMCLSCRSAWLAHCMLVSSSWPQPGRANKQCTWLVCHAPLHGLLCLRSLNPLGLTPIHPRSDCRPQAAVKAAIKRASTLGAKIAPVAAAKISGEEGGGRPLASEGDAPARRRRSEKDDEDENAEVGEEGTVQVWKGSCVTTRMRMQWWVKWNLHLHGQLGKTSAEWGRQAAHSALRCCATDTS